MACLGARASAWEQQLPPHWVAAHSPAGCERRPVLFVHPASLLLSCTPAVKQRIRAIKNIGKITKAMKMVAASKMRNAQTAVEHSRGIVEPFVRLFGDYPGET